MTTPLDVPTPAQIAGFAIDWRAIVMAGTDARMASESEDLLEWERVDCEARTAELLRQLHAAGCRIAGPDEATRIGRDITDERQRQNDKWGRQLHSWPEWISILTEEVGEAATDANKAHWSGIATRDDYLARLRVELVQTAAVAVQIIEHIDEALAAPGDGGEGTDG